MYWTAGLVFCLVMNPVRVWAKFRAISVWGGKCLTRSCEGIPSSTEQSGVEGSCYVWPPESAISPSFTGLCVSTHSHCKKLLWRRLLRKQNKTWSISKIPLQNLINLHFTTFLFLIYDLKMKSEDEVAVFVQLSSLMWCWKRCIRSSALWLDFGFSGLRA